ncbi:MAG: polysaccharide biosynthesis C-terminal domain-containing protein, partial [Dehalococcoidia bacterium]
ISVAANLLLNLWLVRVLGFRGLALGTAIAAVLNAVVLLALLSRRLDGLDGHRIADSAVRILLASAVMGLVVWSTSAWLSTAVPLDGFWGRLVSVFTSIAAGVFSLVAAARLFHIEELDDAMRRIAARFGRKR